MPANLTYVQKFETERPDPFQQPVQAGLIEVGVEYRDRAIRGPVEPRECLGCLVVEFADDADFVTSLHGRRP